jgi:hypothetical protein
MAVILLLLAWFFLFYRRKNMNDTNGETDPPSELKEEVVELPAKQEILELPLQSPVELSAGQEMRRENGE